MAVTQGTDLPRFGSPFMLAVSSPVKQGDLVSRVNREGKSKDYVAQLDSFAVGEYTVVVVQSAGASKEPTKAELIQMLNAQQRRINELTSTSGK